MNEMPRHSRLLSLKSNFKNNEPQLLKRSRAKKMTSSEQQSRDDVILTLMTMQ